MKKLEVFTDYSLPLESATQTFAIVARKRVGKTYLASVMAEEFIKAGIPIVVLDPTGAWWGLRSSADGKRDGFPVVIIGGSHADVPLTEHSGKVIADLVVDYPGNYIIDFSQTESQAAADRFATEFAKHFYRRKESNRFPMQLMVDEADCFMPEQPFPKQRAMLGAFDTIVRRGGIFGIGVTLITQRPAVLSKNVLTQAETLIALQISGIDQDAVDKHWIKRHGTPEQRAEMIGSLAGLQKGDAWLWSPSWLNVFRRVRARTRETFNSSATPEVGKKVIVPKRLAPVDIAALGEKIKAAVEQQKANDPDELKKRNAELEKKLKIAESKPEKISATKTVEVSILNDVDRKYLAKRLLELEMIQGNIVDGGKRAEKAASEVKTQIERLFQKMPSLAKAAPFSPAPAVKAAARHASAPRLTVPAPSPESQREPQATQEVGKGAREVLKAIAQSQDGASDTQIGVLTGYKSTSRSVFKQQLASKGFITKGGRGFLATQEGIDFLGSDFEQLPTGDALREHWTRTLSGGELILFQIYVKNYPNEVSNEQIGIEANYKSTSVSVFRQKLVARNLIVTNRGSAKASPLLFE